MKANLRHTFTKQPDRLLTPVSQQSRSVSALLKSALEYHRAGLIHQAHAIYSAILAFDPNHADSLHLLGMIAYADGDHESAIRNIRRAIAINKNEASYHSNLGTIVHQQGKLEEAAECYQHALVLKPELAEAHYNLGNVFHAQEQLEEAIACYEQALSLNSKLPEAHYNLGNALQSQDKFEEAIAAYRRALALDRGKYEALHNWGNALQSLGKLEEAMTCYERVLIVHPAYAKAHYSVGCALQAFGKPTEAIASYRQARALDPDFAQAGLSESLAQLLQGEYAEGWQNYEWRWQSKAHNTPMRNYSQPLWRGARLSSGPVLIWGEQGVGDEIMFTGLMPEAMRTGNKFIMDCDARLQPLFARSFPDVTVVPRHAEADRSANPANDKRGVAFSAHLPTGSLPGLFRATPAAFAATKAPYLIADPIARERFRGRYTEGTNTRLAGITWHTNSRNYGRTRSIDLSTLLPLLAIPEVRWISLQYGNHDLLEKEAAEAGAPIHIDRTVDQLSDIDLFAAQVAAMDIVVTIDNSTAHLAGALGVETLTLLPFAPDWRWLRDREDSPWYPTMRLLRQPKRGDWESVMQKLKQLFY
jgi:tetratricopeptide (TPR) repeat protein